MTRLFLSQQQQQQHQLRSIREYPTSYYSTTLRQQYRRSLSSSDTTGSTTSTTSNRTSNSSSNRTSNSSSNSSSSSGNTTGNNKDTTTPPPLILDPLVICGVSGIGKSTIIQRFLQVQQLQYDATIETNNNTISLQTKYPKPIFVEYVKSVSHTTRLPRSKEVDGVHYHFVDIDSMKYLISAGGQQHQKVPESSSSSSTSSSSSWASSYFIENVKIQNHFYGTSWDSILKVHTSNQKTIGNTRIVRKSLLSMNIQGVQTLKQIEEQQKQQVEHGDIVLPFLLQPKYIFLAPPNLRSLQERLIARGSITNQNTTESSSSTPKLSLVTRTNHAIHEMNYGLDVLRYAHDTDLDVMYRKSNNFHNVLVYGTSVNDTVDELMICIDRIYNIPEMERPQHIKANKAEDLEPIQIYEEFM